MSTPGQAAAIADQSSRHTEDHCTSGPEQPPSLDATSSSSNPWFFYRLTVAPVRIVTAGDANDT
jgi:hypothetical protein